MRLLERRADVLGRLGVGLCYDEIGRSLVERRREYLQRTSWFVLWAVCGAVACGRMVVVVVVVLGLGSVGEYLLLQIIKNGKYEIQCNVNSLKL